jgi:Ca-activated chloride channel family protein
LSLGLPAIASNLTNDPTLLASYRFSSGDHTDAAETFSAVGQPYNAGVAAAWARDYASALAAWDAALLVNPTDHEARTNRDLIVSLFAGTEFLPTEERPAKDRGGDDVEANIGQGGARAASTGDDATGNQSGFTMPEVAGSGLRRVPKIFDAQYIKANDEWLTTLPDEPGLYLSARIAAEQKARAAAGTALPPAGDPE